MMLLPPDWLASFGTACLELFWRPALAWTVLAVPVYLGLRSWRNAPPLVLYHAHLALLLALPLGIVLAPHVSFPSAPELSSPVTIVESSGVSAQTESEALLPSGVAPEEAFRPAWGMSHAWGVVSILGGLLSFALLVRALGLALALGRYRRGLLPVDDAAATALLHAVMRDVGVRRSVTLYTTSTRSTPMTFGLRRPAIIVPEVLLGDEAALRVTLTHELIHVRRLDYAVNWIVRVLAGLFAVHPGVWLLRRRIDQYREISCDAEALVGTRVEVPQYARLLLRFSPLVDLAGPMPLRMVELDSTLKQRLTAMHMHLRQESTTGIRLRRWSLPIALFVLLAPALLAACTTKSHNSETVIVSGEAAYDGGVEERRAREEGELQHKAESLERLVVELKALEDRGEKERAVQLREEIVSREQELQVAEEMQREAELEAKKRAEEAEFSGTALRLLELQMTYLEQQIQQVGQEVEALEARETQSEAVRLEYGLLRQRADLLNNMYRERLRQFELMKMEQFTRAALGNMQ